MPIAAESHGLWSQSAPSNPATVALATNRRVDVAVIGAGFTGLSAALHLAEAGSRVVVLDAEDIGFGGSGRNVGLVNAGLWVMPSAISKALGAEYGERLLSMLGDAPQEVYGLVSKHGMDCEAMHVGTLHCAVGDAGLRDIEARYSEWKARGAPVELLDSAAAARALGTSAYRGALLDKRAGTIQPLAYARGLGRAAIAAGATVYSNSPVQGCERDGSVWRLLTPGGSVTADWVIVATNAFSSGPFQMIRQALVRLPYFQCATDPLPEHLLKNIIPGRQGAWDTKDVLSSFRLDAAGRFIFGSVGALRAGGQQVHPDWARRAMAKLFPALAGIPFSHEWYGWIGMTDDALPRFFELGPQMVTFSGYNGRGIGPGTVFGRVLAQHVSRRSNDLLPLPVTQLSGVDWRQLKEFGYEAGAAAAHLVAARV